MKKKLGYTLLTICLLLWVSYLVFVPTPKILTPIEETGAKAGKTFWQWNSPYGSYATHYVEKGTGDKHIILIHGFRAYSYTWIDTLEPLANAGYHVWAIDLIGCGLSDMPKQFPYQNDNLFVTQVEDFIKDHHLGNVHIIGSSLGGGIALKLALSKPEQVKSLTLIAALGYPLKLPTYLAVGKHLGQLTAPFLGPKMVEKGLRNLVYHKDIVTDEKVAAYYLPLSIQGGAYASIETLKGYDPQKLVDLSKRYSAIKQPLFIIWGENDPLIPVSHFKLFVQDFPNARQLLLQKCGHLPQEEYPTKVNEEILDFYRQIDPHKK